MIIFSSRLRAILVVVFTTCIASGEPVVRNADPTLALILEKHLRATETSFTVSIQAERNNGKTNSGTLHRGQVAGGWATRLDIPITTVVLRGKTFHETTIDRPDYRVDLFEANKTGVKAGNFDPTASRANQVLMQPPLLDRYNTLMRYQAEGKAPAGETPPSLTLITAKESFFSALRQQSSKEHLKLFPYRMEISWFPDRYLIRSLKSLNSDGDVIAIYRYEYRFDRVAEETFAIPAEYAVTEVTDRISHMQALSKAKMDASRSTLVQAGIPTNTIAQAERKAATSGPKKEKLTRTRSAFFLIFGSLVGVGLLTVFAFRLMARRRQPGA